MSSHHNTQYYGEEKIVSDTHYTLGSKILMTNLDCLEYVYKNGKLTRVCLIDYKHKGEKLSTKWDPVQCQADLARDLDLPLFFVITYLNPQEYDVPMYFTLPVNKKAVENFPDIGGKWMTVKQYAEWHHQIRGIEIPEKDKDQIHLLSNAFKKYSLPDLSEMEILP